MAAQARKDAAEAVKWADKAQKSADEAADYAEQADRSADQAAKSAERAAESAKKAQSAAASARADARAANRSAEQAVRSAGLASSYASQANTAAYQAAESAAAAGKDAKAAAKAATQALKTAADKLVAELKAQIQKELGEDDKPLSEKEWQKLITKRLYEAEKNIVTSGDLRPGETILICASGGPGVIGGCTESTYLERLVAWYTGAFEIEECLQKVKAKCLDDLVLSALKIKALKGLKSCEKATVSVSGARAPMSDQRARSAAATVRAAAAKCPNGRLSDKLPQGLSKKYVHAYEEIRAGRGSPRIDDETGMQKVFRGDAVHEKPWAGALEFNVPGADPNNARILVKTLPDGRKVMGWSKDHYKTIKPFTAPHFPDDGWR